MALTTCYECSENISEDARICPSCGAKQFKLVGFKDLIKQIFWSLISIISISILLQMFFDINMLISTTPLAIIFISLTVYAFNKRVNIHYFVIIVYI